MLSNRYLILSVFFSLLVFSQVSAFSGDFSVTSSGNTPSIEKRKSIITTLLGHYATIFPYKTLSIFIDERLIEPRGKIYGSKISLSSRVLRDGEFIKLFVHEFGHYVDLYVLFPVAGKDSSDDFYRISWKDTTVKKASEGISSFVSGYAATNKYEDFAESFTFYIFHNTYFADKALKNESLRQKYIFFSQNVFPDGQFVETDFSTLKIPNYIWDTTKVPISLQKYLYSLN